jgi:hypothetical protein
MKYESMKKVYEDAVFIFNGAVNMVAITKTMSEMTLFMREQGMSTDEINHHPAIALIICQMTSLADMSFSCSPYIHDCYEKAQASQI